MYHLRAVRGRKDMTVGDWYPTTVEEADKIVEAVRANGKPRDKQPSHFELSRVDGESETVIKVIDF